MISRQGETPLEKTIYVLKNMNLFDMSPFKEKEAYFRRLLDVANVNALSPKRWESEDLPWLEGHDGVRRGGGGNKR